MGGQRLRIRVKVRFGVRVSISVIVSVRVTLRTSFNVTVILFGIYTIIAFFAFVQWKKEYESKTSTTI